MIADAFQVVRNLIGDPSFAQEADVTAADAPGEAKPSAVVTKNVVLADGTYSVVTTQVESATRDDKSANASGLRKLITGKKANVQLACVAAVALTKLALKMLLNRHTGIKYSPAEAGNAVVQTVLIATGVAKMVDAIGRSNYSQDCIDRLNQCCRMLLDPAYRAKMADQWIEGGRTTFTNMVQQARLLKTKASEADKRKGVNSSQPDDLIQFRQLRAQAVQGGIEVDLMDADDISRAAGGDGAGTGAAGSKLKHIYQLTGYSDPVYAEASVVVHDYDILLDILVINRTPNTLTNLTIELATMGDLKLVERPQSYNIGPLDERRVSASIKVSSTETGHIFGTIVFDNASNAQKTYVNLNDIQLNIMDYIRPAECKNEEFRSMWAEFEWENKVSWFVLSM
jgi:coatomer subunit beta